MHYMQTTGGTYIILISRRMSGPSWFSLVHFRPVSWDARLGRVRRHAGMAASRFVRFSLTSGNGRRDVALYAPPSHRGHLLDEGNMKGVEVERRYLRLQCLL